VGKGADESELKKVRAAGKRTGAGSIFSNTSGSSIPNELTGLVAAQHTFSKLVLPTKMTLNTANKDYDKLTDPAVVTPTLPVHAARLNGLLKTLANAENAVIESIKARKLLIESLEKILNTNQTALVTEEEELARISSRKAEIDNKKRDVEDSIMRGLSNPSTPAGPTSGPTANQPSLSPAPEPGRPEVEALTPPVYAQPPPRSPAPQLDLDAPNGNGTYFAPADVPQMVQPPPQAAALPGLSPSNSYGNSYGRPASAASGSSAKKRKLNTGDDFPDFGGEDAMDGLDADVAEMLRQESGNGA
jgi:regulator of Ty1 transposition protein 103